MSNYDISYTIPEARPLTIEYSIDLFVALAEAEMAVREFGISLVCISDKIANPPVK